MMSSDSLWEDGAVAIYCKGLVGSDNCPRRDNCARYATDPPRGLVWYLVPEIHETDDLTFWCQVTLPVIYEDLDGATQPDDDAEEDGG